MNTQLSDLLDLYPGAARLVQRYALRTNDDPSDMRPCPTVEQQFLVDAACAMSDASHTSRHTFERYSIATLVDYLLRAHRYYLGEALPSVEMTFNQLLENSEHHRPLLLKAAALFSHFSNDLRAHIIWEEQGLFPHALQLEALRDGRQSRLDLKPRVTESFAAHHPSHADELSEILGLLGEICAARHAHMALPIVAVKVRQLYDDLGLHCLIEDEVLLPKITLLEATLGI